MLVEFMELTQSRTAEELASVDRMGRHDPLSGGISRPLIIRKRRPVLGTEKLREWRAPVEPVAADSQKKVARRLLTEQWDTLRDANEQHRRRSTRSAGDNSPREDQLFLTGQPGELLGCELDRSVRLDCDGKEDVEIFERSIVHPQLGALVEQSLELGELFRDELADILRVHRG